MSSLIPVVPSRCEQLTLRGLHVNVRHWGPPDAPLAFFLHGWMDASATFQFVVDALAQTWHVIAPDWRGYGATTWLERPYWFQDYYGDLDALLAHYSPDRPARLVGHSMGANIAAIYAAACPARVAQVAMLDFLGLPAPRPEEAPARLAQWLNHLNENPELRRYRDTSALARRLQAVNPRLTPERAAFLATHVGRPDADGQVVMACDPWHKIPSPQLYRIDETLACWRAIEAPVLMVIADHGFVSERFDDLPDERARRLACFRQLQTVTIRDSGHNLQHDQPEQVAAALERFLTRN